MTRLLCDTRRTWTVLCALLSALIFPPQTLNAQQPSQAGAGAGATKSVTVSDAKLGFTLPAQWHQNVIRQKTADGPGLALYEREVVTGAGGQKARPVFAVVTETVGS